MSFARVCVRADGLERDSVTGDGWLAAPGITIDATDGASTITAAAIAKGIHQATTASAPANLTLATAAQILAALPQMEDGDIHPFMVSNLGASTLTVITAAGITLSGTVACLTLTARWFLVQRTSSTTVNVIGL